MFLIKLIVENVRSIALLGIKIHEGKVHLLHGWNGAGKSSLMDALFAALLGKNYAKKFPGHVPTRIIRDGENKAKIIIEVNQGEIEFIVERVIERTGDNVSFEKLRIVKSTGSLTTKDVVNLFKIQSIDLLSFMSKVPAEQLNTLQSFVNQDDLATITGKLQAVNEEAGIRNAALRNCNDRIRNAKRTTDIAVPDIKNLQEQQEELQSTLDNYNATVSTGKQKKIALTNKETRLQELYEEIDALQEQAKALETDCAEDKEVLTALLKECTGIDIEKVKEQLEKNKEVMRSVSAAQAEKAEYMRYVQDIKQKEEVNKELDKLNAAKKLLVQEKADLFKNVGITTDIDFSNEQGVILDGVPFVDMSTGEQIRELCKIIYATFEEGQVKLCYIKNANVLDKRTLAVLDECAKKYKIAFLLEWVSESAQPFVEVYEKKNDK